MRLLASLLLLTACGITPDWTRVAPRPEPGLPAVLTPPPLPPGAEPAGCLNPLTAPGDGTRFVMLRSSAEGSVRFGDYEVEGGKYGVGPRELVRVDCVTWKPLGVVPR